MQQLRRLAPFFVAVLLTSAAGCAATSGQEAAGEFVDDTVITTKVKAGIFSEPTLKSAQINVETFKGVVLLSGVVGNQANIYKAAEVARNVNGVVNVRNDMRLR